MSQVAWRAIVFRHVADARLVRIQTGEQGGAGRATAARVIELGEAQAAGGEFVKIGRGDFTAITAEVGKTHIINQDNYDVRFGRSGGG